MKQRIEKCVIPADEALSRLLPSDACRSCLMSLRINVFSSFEFVDDEENNQLELIEERKRSARMLQPGTAKRGIASIEWSRNTLSNFVDTFETFTVDHF